MLQFVVDHNVGKLARWLRMMGFDSLFFTGDDDLDMVKQALADGRILLTRDAEIMKRRVVISGRLKAVLFRNGDSERQMRQLLSEFDLVGQARPFTLCLECNRSLVARRPEEVESRVPPYVFSTQTRYMECPACHRIYWQGTHWQAMQRKLAQLRSSLSLGGGLEAGN